MKILFSQIKKLLPELRVLPKDVGEMLTNSGFLMEGIEEIGNIRNRDTVVSFEVRQNRADCLSAIGIAREIATAYGLKFIPPTGFVDQPITGVSESLNIKVHAKEVRRVMAVEIEGVTNAESPDWLKHYLEPLGMNSVNLLVDLSNYLMLTTGYPPHLFDADKITGGLMWEVNRSKQVMETFDGTQIQLSGGELVISDQTQPLALAGLVGCKKAAVLPESKNIILEIANYDPSIVRDNARKLRVFTEAGSRLDKQLSPAGIPSSLNLMITLIKQHCGGTVTKAYDHYPEPVASQQIELNLSQPSQVAGIEIDPNLVVEYLTRLGCVVTGESETRRVVTPIERTDLLQAEDLVEEVIRLFGYGKIPAGLAPTLEYTKDITSPILQLGDKIRDFWADSGFDEVLTCPLVSSDDNAKIHNGLHEPVITQNPINEGYPELRAGMIPGLVGQRNEYWKRGINFCTLFEIGRIFYQIRGKIFEEETLAVLINYRQGVLSENERALLPNNLAEFRLTIEKMLRSLGLSHVAYKQTGNIPLALPKNTYQILINQEVIGMIYKVRENQAGCTYAAQVNMSKLVGLISKQAAAVEVEMKLVTLDANVILPNESALDDYLVKLNSKIPKEYLWSVNVVDVFKVNSGFRYTIRVTFFGIGDQAAKTLHAKIFP